MYQRLALLFADYEEEEIAVLTDWFTRAQGWLFEEALAKIRE
ncbi:hypothetical protein [Streptomyces sp. MN13]